MKSKKSLVTALESSLSRFLDADNSEQVNDPLRFNELCAPYFNRASALDAMREYLKSNKYSPRVLGMLIYSQKGVNQVLSWVENGLDPGLIYAALLHDGGFWVKAKPRLGLDFAIINGNRDWDFDPKIIFPKLEPITCAPGTIAAMVARLRRQNRLREVFRHIPFNTLYRILETDAEVFAPELDKLSYTRSDIGEGWPEVAGMEIVRNSMMEQSLFEKLIGHKAAC